MKTDDRANISAYEIDQGSRQGDLRSALESALQAIRAGALDSELFYVAARISFQLGNLQKAEQLVRMLLAADPDYINGWMLFGRIYSRKGDIARATYGLKRAEEIFPAISELNIDADGDEAPRPVPTESVVSISSKSISFETATFADICVRQGYLNKALKIYSDLLKKNPDDEALKQKISEIKSKTGMND